MAAQQIVILGASTRAAAMSAHRAGYVPYCADLFADTDLSEFCRAIKVSRYPDGLADAARNLPDCEWMYTGALENYPQLVDRIAAERSLLGNDGDVLRTVRNPFHLVDWLSANRFPAPQVQVEPPPSGHWLRKPYRSSSGHRIESWDPDRQPICRAAADSQSYFQQRVAGRPISAVFVAGKGRAMMLGATRQLIGSRWLAAHGFVYAGSLGPLHLNPTTRNNLILLGNGLARQFHLRGLFGVDLLQQGRQICPVEVNPRYPASAEILERSLRFSAVGCHVAACRSGRLPVLSTDTAAVIYGKAIQYSVRQCIMTEAAYDYASSVNRGTEWPGFADIPAPGTEIRAGQPIATALAGGATTRIVMRKLQSLWQRFSDCL